ncbi:MAG: polyprenyl synthetase family protein [Gemmatimonadetes bacterium]|nr:polyprenyl synthetase family protein [Gemmatimonadota bacterium]MBI3567181.1 polyprenyl synthetase family protein [Gemmatimonadota bacterium]
MTVAAPAPFDFAADRAAVGHALARLAGEGLAVESGAVAESVRYALAGEGKRLRAVLLMAAYRAAGGTGDASALGAAVEVVHAYSLVHDDLPCMDDDDMRRGRPTVHKAFGVAAATAAGLVMVPLAARAATEAAMALGLDRSAVTEIVRTLMRASGAGGMVGGQLLDLEGEGRSLTLPELERVHRLKTGALIAASVRLGALAAGARAPVLAALDRYGDAVGLAFQIADDVLDLTATSDELGKTAGRDLALQKSTYPALLGIDEARARAESLCADACAALGDAGIASPALEQLARLIVHRRS